MAKTIIEVDGKRYQVVRSENQKLPCVGCAFYNEYCNAPSECPRDIPCLEFDENTLYYHILKELK